MLQKVSLCTRYLSQDENMDMLYIIVYNALIIRSTSMGLLLYNDVGIVDAYYGCCCSCSFYKTYEFTCLGLVHFWSETVRRQVVEIIENGEIDCNAEMYCNDQFVELESLAPLGKLNPGEKSNTHRKLGINFTT